MASPEIVVLAEAPRKKARKQNFSLTEIATLTEKVEENLAILQSKLTNSITNQKKNELWSKIAAAVNAVGTEKRTLNEVKEKWKNLHSSAKKEFVGFTKKRKKTGGGPNLYQICIELATLHQCSHRLKNYLRDEIFVASCVLARH